MWYIQFIIIIKEQIKYYKINLQNIPNHQMKLFIDSMPLKMRKVFILFLADCDVQFSKQAHWLNLI